MVAEWVLIGPACATPTPAPASSNVRHPSACLHVHNTPAGICRYSKELCAVIRSMLRRIFQQRPSAADLVQLPYVRSCLALSKSALVADDAKRDAPSNSVKPTTTKK